MSDVDDAIWRQLARTSTRSGILAARPAISGRTTALLAALDHDQSRHLLLAVPPETAFDDDLSRGLTVSTRSLVVEGTPEALYIDLHCEDTSGRDAFNLIAGEIADLVDQSALTPVEAVRRVLTRWRHFWGRTPDTGLTREELTGLFGELWFLLNWLMPHRGVAAVGTWIGSAGARHDFQWPGGGVEVKTTTSTRGDIHRINGIDQLDEPDDGRLLFFSLRVREEPASSNSVPSIIESCQNRLSTDPEAVAALHAKLAQRGYTPIQADAYGEMRFRIAGEALFAVRDSFPRIIRSSFSDGSPPAGIEHIDYEINLAGYEHLRIATRPDEASALDVNRI